jgi:hypothetical protein
MHPTVLHCCSHTSVLSHCFLLSCSLSLYSECTGQSHKVTTWHHPLNSGLHAALLWSTWRAPNTQFYAAALCADAPNSLWNWCNNRSLHSQCCATCNCQLASGFFETAPQSIGIWGKGKWGRKCLEDCVCYGLKQYVFGTCCKGCGNCQNAQAAVEEVKRETVDRWRSRKRARGTIT